MGEPTDVMFQRAERSGIKDPELTVKDRHGRTETYRAEARPYERPTHPAEKPLLYLFRSPDGTSSMCSGVLDFDTARKAELRCGECGARWSVDLHPTTGPEGNPLRMSDGPIRCPGGDCDALALEIA